METKVIMDEVKFLKNYLSTQTIVKSKNRMNEDLIKIRFYQRINSQ